MSGEWRQASEFLDCWPGTFPKTYMCSLRSSGEGRRPQREEWSPQHTQSEASVNVCRAYLFWHEGYKVTRPAPRGAPSSRAVEHQRVLRQYVIPVHWGMLVVGLTACYVLKDFKFLRFRATQSRTLFLKQKLRENVSASSPTYTCTFTQVHTRTNAKPWWLFNPVVFKPFQ